MQTENVARLELLVRHSQAKRIAVGKTIEMLFLLKTAGPLLTGERASVRAGLEAYAGPGHWNDPDMLEVGNGGMTENEYRAHFSLWCILAAPLIAGNDIRNMTPAIANILMNKEVIAVDQDPLGLQGRRVKREVDLDYWMKQLADGSRAVALLNRGTTEKQMSITWRDIGYPEHLSASVRDLWAKKDVGKMNGGFSAPVGSHSVLMVRITP